MKQGVFARASYGATYAPFGRRGAAQDATAGASGVLRVIVETELSLGEPDVEVAVGTALSGRPPHRSEHALLTHSAPASGSDVEALVGPGMENAGLRNPALRKPTHRFPVGTTTLATARERVLPMSLSLGSERLH